MVEPGIGEPYLMHDISLGQIPLIVSNYKI